MYPQAILENNEYHIVNFILENKGHGDTNVNIELHFKGFTQITDFYDRKIQAKKPYEPSSYLGVMPNFNLNPANKLGNLQEVQTDKASLVVIEIDCIRHSDKVWLHYNPIFIKKSNTKKEIEYSIKSDQLTATETRTIDLK